MNNLQIQIDKYHANKPQTPRPHLGASLLGHHCERYIWLSFRWAIAEQFTGRILRLFRRGQLEESVVICDIENAGHKVTGEQTRVEFGSHVSGSIDGIIDGQYLLEIKTHNEKSFNDLVTKGVQKSKPQHYAQMQVYMRGLDLAQAIYFAVCKNDDRLHIETVQFDAEFADKMIAKGQRIALSERIPEPISGDPTWYQCKMCAASDICHNGAELAQNCRTCAKAKPMPEGVWYCGHWFADIPFEAQQKGCEQYAPTVSA